MVKLPLARGLRLLAAALLTALLCAAGTALNNGTVSLPDPRALLFSSAGLPHLTPESELAAAVETTAPPPEEALLVIARPQPAEERPLAVVYCTHTSEEYKGQSRQKGVAGGVLEAARALAAALEEEGVEVILDETVHDRDYEEAYEHSLAALEKIKADHPELRLFIDVHRDSAIAGISTILNAEGEDYAKMLLIVGSDERLPHPDWEANRDFARQVATAANEILPGVMREPRVYSGRYNQHIGDRALLVEIGSTDNSVEEAQRSAAVLARAVAESL